MVLKEDSRLSLALVIGKTGGASHQHPPLWVPGRDGGPGGELGASTRTLPLSEQPAFPLRQLPAKAKEQIFKKPRRNEIK